MNISMRQALNRGQTKLETLRQLQTSAAEHRLAEAREKVRQRQLAVLEAFPVFIRRYVKFDYSMDNPTLAPGGNQELVVIQVPELAPVQVFLQLVLSNWEIGSSGYCFRVPAVHGDEIVGPEWEFRQFFATDDLDVALAVAHERGIKYRLIEATFKKNKAPEPEYEDVDA